MTGASFQRHTTGPAVCRKRGRPDHRRVNGHRRANIYLPSGEGEGISGGVRTAGKTDTVAYRRRSYWIFHHRNGHTLPGRAYVEIRKHGRTRTMPAQALQRARLERLSGRLHAVAERPGEPHSDPHSHCSAEMCAPAAKKMNGAASLVRTLVAGGVGVCFANPGTS